MLKAIKHRLLLAIAIGSAIPLTAFASTTTAEPTVGLIFLWLAIILIGAKIGGAVEKIGQSGVLGELIYGIILGNLALLGWYWLEPMRDNEIIHFLANLGIVILLFQIGLESNIKEMQRLGLRAAAIAIIGVVATLLLGSFVAGPLLLPNESLATYLFLGAALTATSVSISARVFKDLGRINTEEARLVLGAAVIDDVLGLIILAIASAMFTAGSISIGIISWITFESIAFLVGAIIIGQLMAPLLGKLLAKIQTGIGMKFTLAICFGLILAYLAEKIGLAPLIGAFAAGLILDPVHFHYFKDHQIVHSIKKAVSNFQPKEKNHVLGIIEPYADRHISDLIEPLVHFLVPVFFVMTGFAVDLTYLTNPRTLLLAIGLTAVAIIGKLLAGLAAGRNNKLIVGMGMVPRGEVELIFAVTGKSLGIFNDQVFAAIVIMVILTALVVPPILSYLIKRSSTQV